MIKKVWIFVFLGLFFFSAPAAHCLEYKGMSIPAEAVQNVSPQTIRQLPPEVLKQLPADVVNRITKGQKTGSTAPDPAGAQTSLPDNSSINALDGPAAEALPEPSLQAEDGDTPPEAENQIRKTAAAQAASVIETQYRYGYSSLLAGELTQFGYDIFRSAKAKPSGLAVPDKNYLLGTGDNLLIRVWGSSVDVEYPAVVDREGVINVPKLGPIPVAGVRYGDVESVVKKEAEKYIQGININITLVKLRSLEVYVVGEVKNPGLHMLPAFSTIFDGLLYAGGVKKTGTLRKIRLFRDETEIQLFDLYDLLLAGNRTSDTTLQNKDVVFVGEIGKTAAVAGAVNHQAIFEITGQKSIRELVDLAGGTLPQAFGDRIYLRRFDQNREFVVQDINLDKNPDAWTTIRVTNGDLLELDFMGSTLPFVVRLSGNVWKPDIFNYQAGMNLSDVLTTPDLLMPDSLTEFALIYRYDRETTRTRPMRFPLSEVFSGQYDAPLQPYDKIVILSRKKIGIRETVTLKGAVWKPGRYRFDPGLKLADALALAGGVKNEARTDKIEVARQVRTDEKFETAYLKLNLKKDTDFTLQPNDAVFIPLLKDYVVTLEGHVWNPRVFKYHAHITLADVLISRDLPKPEDLLKPGALMDFGLIYRYDGKTTRTKAVRFPLSRVFDGTYDAVLQPFDKIVVLSREKIGIREAFQIAGAVWNGGQYNYQPGLRLTDALALAGGLQFGAGTKRIELARQVIKGNRIETEYRRLDLEKDGGFLIMPHDSILVPRVKDASRVKKITLTGEVRYPGTYTIRENEKVSDLIARAGGFTPDAYFYGARYTAVKAKAIQQKSIDKMIERLQLSYMQTTSEMAQTATSTDDAQTAQVAGAAVQGLLAKLRSVRAEGRVAIKLADLASFTDSLYDFKLEDGDTLDIPAKPAFVSVVGSVYSPGSFLYQPNRKLDFYLDKSGGVAKTADKKHVYLLKANGEILAMSQSHGVFKKFGSTILMPGDTIVVPENLERVPYLKIVKDVSDIIFKIATTAGIAFAI